MNGTDPQLDYLLVTHEVQYAIAIGAVAVLVLMLLRRRPTVPAVALFLAGALLALAGAPLLESSLTLVDRSVVTGSTRLIQVPEFWRSLIVGGGAAVVGVVCIGRAWRDTPER